MSCYDLYGAGVFNLSKNIWTWKIEALLAIVLLTDLSSNISMGQPSWNVVWIWTLTRWLIRVLCIIELINMFVVALIVLTNKNKVILFKYIIQLNILFNTLSYVILVHRFWIKSYCQMSDNGAHIYFYYGWDFKWRNLCVSFGNIDKRSFCSF